MKNKTFNFVIASLSLLVLMTNFSSAAFSVSETSLTFDQDTNTQTFTITNLNESELLNVIFSSTITIGDFSFEITGNKTEINASEPRTFNVTSNSANDFADLDFGEVLSTTFQIVDALNSSNTNTITISVEKTEFCDYNNLEELEIKSIDLKNKGIAGTTKFGDEDEWYAFEEIEVEVEIKNDGRYDMSNIQLEWGLYDTNSNQWVIEVEEEDSDFDLDRGDTSDTIVFTIILDSDLDIDLEDLDSGENYILYVRAIGEIDDSDSSNDGELTCASKDETIRFLEERDFVIVTNFDQTYQASCGSEVSIDAELWNIGTRDQQDIRVTLTNYLLGINEELSFDDLNAFDSEDFTMRFDIPEDIKEGTYELIFTVIDEDNDIYEVDKTKAEFSVFVEVQGSCKTEIDLEISAEASEVKAGEDAVVKVTITNLESTTQTFGLGLTSYSSWATDAELSSDYVVIKAGETQEIEITLKTKKDSAGSNVFDLILTSEGNVDTQPIEVEVLENPGIFGISGFAIGGNVYTTGLTILIIVLVIIILVLLIIKKLRK